MISLKADPALSSVQRNLLRWIVAHAQVVFPDETGHPESGWTAAGSDPNGRFEASYSFAPQPPGFQITLRKQRYLELASAPARKKKGPGRLNLDLAIEPSGIAVADFDCGQGVLSKLSATEQTKTHIGESQIAVANDHFELTYQAESPASADRLRELLAGNRAMTATFGLVASESAEDMQRMIQRTELGDLTEAKLLDMLARARKTGDPKAVDALYLKFKALIYLHPESCEKLGEILVAEDPHSKTMMILATALSTVGSPAAQKALVSALRTRSDDIAAAEALIPAIGMTDHPTVESEQALKDLIASSKQEEVITTAGLSLGVMASRLGEDDPSRQKQIVESVEHDYEHADTLAQKRFLVSVLGNAGSPDTLPLLEDALVAPDPALQAEAAMALRFIPGTEAEDHLLGTLAQGQSDSVREAAAAALDYRDPSPDLSERMRTSFAAEKSEGVRRQLVKDIYDERLADPKVRDWLKSVKDSDPSEDVRKVAASYYSLLDAQGT